MKSFIGLVLAVALIGTVRCNDPGESIPGVLDLTIDNFKTVLNGRKAALVEFYAPWCGHCKSLVPEMKTLGGAYLQEPSLADQVVIAKVNADKYHELGSIYGVQGFPTIMWLPRGKSEVDARPYNGARTSVGMMDFIKSELKKDAAYARIEELTDIARKLIQAEASDAGALIDDAKKFVEGLSGSIKSNGELYIKYMQKVADKGAAYVEKEISRLNKLIDGGMSPSKQAEVDKKLSVLTAFTAASEVEEEEEPMMMEEEY
ncbi:hypothetical protein M9435_005234 [Picochlorum sp. BPE23]|nr:hypothetical protein M9435_005234 [Picochlorum sp. BPE23]